MQEGKGESGLLIMPLLWGLAPPGVPRGRLLIRCGSSPPVPVGGAKAVRPEIAPSPFSPASSGLLDIPHPDFLLQSVPSYIIAWCPGTKIRTAVDCIDAVSPMNLSDPSCTPILLVTPSIPTSQAKPAKLSPTSSYIHPAVVSCLDLCGRDSALDTCHRSCIQFLQFL